MSALRQIPLNFYMTIVFFQKNLFTITLDMPKLLPEKYLGN